MNPHNVIYTELLHEVSAEWADRAPDDEDRYAPDSIIIVGSGETKAQAYTDLCEKYDLWIKETRG